MGWDNIGDIGVAVATGGLSEAAKALKGKKQNMEQVPLETPEQRAARQKLMEFANTGKFGDFQAGADLGLGIGDFGMTGIEGQGLSSLQSLLQSGIPSQFGMGDAALKNMLGSTQEQIQSQFDPFKVQTERQIRESNDAFKRSASFGGNLYSSKTMEGLGDIQARGNETLTSELARLTNSALDRQLSAIPLAYQSGKDQENLSLNRVAASQQYGGLTRNLNNAAIQARDAEILRKRQELQLPIQAAQTVSGQTANFGIPSIPYQQQSPYMDLLKIAAQGFGAYMGAQ